MSKALEAGSRHRLCGRWAKVTMPKKLRSIALPYLASASKAGSAQGQQTLHRRRKWGEEETHPRAQSAQCRASGRRRQRLAMP